MKAVLFGASKGMGRALARLMAARGDRLFLIGRATDDLERSARDLEIRGAPAPVKTAYCDLLAPESFAPALDQAERELQGFDTVVVTAGLFATQEELENDPQLAARVLAADFTGTVLFCEEARKRLLAVGGGTLCVFSSVAGERGRKPVILYGAAKAGLSQYLEGLDHKFRARGLRTVCVKPGFVKTGMTAGLKPPPFAGQPEAVARRVLRAIDRGRPEVYTPAAWRGVMCIIRNLPRFIMRKIEF
ncbi:MAG: SDR family NAD(P)-dependent oxidoreductase [Planctomycetes bacterium]|nr:SDR family NAD(P)-dependent oxidoreductase [Planctomycetota bacterium]MBU4399412.1 SDR family NAD(P)-dependent oxidoreductase [Planctomycetota bacterium]MCG2682794.1 SDR family NAD(P)-dependent oxidoreductase [Planctomycetales bacterium]